MAAPRRRKIIGHRRRVEDEGEDEGGLEPLDLDDDSLTEGSIGSDDHDAGDDSDTSNIDEASPTVPNVRKTGNGAAKTGGARQRSTLTAAAATPDHHDAKKVSDTNAMLHGLSLDDAPDADAVGEMHFDDVVADSPTNPSSSSAAPIIVSSSSANRQPSEAPGDRRRREHEEYKKRRDEDPAFVPNRGAFFMHDHRHAGPAANGFRPFGRGRGRGRGGYGGTFTPIHQFHTAPSDPTTNAPWTHDMHESVAEPLPSRPPRYMPDDEGPANGNGIIPTCPPNPTPINRMLSTEKHIGNAHIRVYMPGHQLIKEPIVFSGIPMKQYTKLPDHRPPLRRDKPVRISLPDRPPRYVFPAVDRSFIFIPRAMRPNQQRLRGKPRSGLGSIGGYSRRTSVFGGSYYGSAYSPSIALSRRSSLAPDGRDYMFSPTGSVVSRPPLPLPMEPPRPVVRLPPSGQIPGGPAGPFSPMEGAPMSATMSNQGPMSLPHESSINDLPPPQTHPLPQKPTFPDHHRPSSLPMHQPQPQKAVSVADIESPTLRHQTQPPLQPQQHQPYHQAFHQQVPLQVASNTGYPPETHSRQPSYPTMHSTGTPLSQIPERAIHAAPFQPNVYQQQQGPPQGFYGHQQYPMMQPPPPPPQQGFYYPPAGFGGSGMGPSATAPAFVPTGQPSSTTGYSTPAQQQQQPTSQQQQQEQQQQPNGPSAGAGPNLVAQEVNGMVYYYDASQLPTFSGYGAPQGFVPGVVGLGGLVNPSPDAFFYPQQAPGMVYYSQ